MLLFHHLVKESESTLKNFNTCFTMLTLYIDKSVSKIELLGKFGNLIAKFYVIIYEFDMKACAKILMLKAGNSI